MNEYIETLIQLTKENPELNIITMTNYEVCGGDDCVYWKGEIEGIKKDIYYEIKEKIIIGEENIKDELLNGYEQDEKYKQFSDLMLLDKVEFDFKTTNYEEAIFIFIGV
jgi:hypothetical protein